MFKIDKAFRLNTHQAQRAIRIVFTSAFAIAVGLWICSLLGARRIPWIDRAFAAEPKTEQSININAKASLLMEAESGKILLEQNAHEQLAPASVTKVMTMLLIYEALEQERIGWDQIVTISEHASSMGGSQVYLAPEEQQTVRDLVKSIVIASANDAAVAMGEFIAGSEEGFVLMMNNKAEALGMKNTHFKNACGLDTPGHFSSAYDIALMSRELITKHPEVFEFTKVRLDKIIHKTPRGEEEFGLTNTNRLIRSYSGITGLKTGSTGEAMYCISATAHKDDMSLIAVVLGAPDPATRFDSAMKMLDYGYANYAIVSKESAGTPMGNVKIYKGKQESAQAVVKTQTNVLVPKGKNIVIEEEVKLSEGIAAPVAKDTEAGEVIYTHEGKEVGRSVLVVAEPIDKAGLGDIMQRLYSRWLFSK